MLLLRLSGVLLLRLDDNRFLGLLLFHDAPRNTRALLPVQPLPAGLPPGSRAEILKNFRRATRGKEKG